MIRYLYNAKHSEDSNTSGELSVTEIKTAERRLLKIVQRDDLKRRERSELKPLCAFEDNEGLLRIQTKVTRRNDDDFRNPILLPSDHKITSTLIMEEHVRGSHAVVEILLSTLREHFWISQGRKTIRRVLSKYIHCHIYEAQNIRTKSADLPEDRVRDASVCKVVGIDLVGTFYLKDNTQS